MARINDIFSGVKKGEITPIAIRLEPGIARTIGAAIKVYMSSANGKRIAKKITIAMTERNSAPLSSIRCWTIGIFSCCKVSGIIF